MKYCVTCKWTGFKYPSDYYLCGSDEELYCVLSWLEMGRSATSCIPENIQVFKLVEQLEVDQIRNSVESPMNT